MIAIRIDGSLECGISRRILRFALSCAAILPVFICNSVFAEADLPFDLAVSNTITYSDNLMHYSSDQIEEFENGNESYKYQGVKSIDDFAEKIRGEVTGKFNFIEGHPTAISSSAMGMFQFQNTARNYQLYGIQVKQNVGRHKTLKVGYSYLPYYYDRTLFDEETDDYSKAHYGKHSVFCRYWMRIVPSLSGWCQYDLRFKDYNKDFSERDSFENEFSIGLRKNFKHHFSLFASGGFSWLDAKGGWYDDEPKNDVSDQRYHVRGGLSSRLMDRLYLSLDYLSEWIIYTTSNSAAADPYHSGRHDWKQSIGGELTYRLAKNVECSVGYKYIMKDKNLSSDESDDEATDELSYRENLAFATVRVKL